MTDHFKQTRRFLNYWFVFVACLGVGMLGFMCYLGLRLVGWVVTK